MKKILACVLVKTKVLWILLFLGNLMWQGGTFVAQAQAPYVARAELPVVEDDDPFSVLTVGQLGLLVVMKQNDLFSVRPQRMVYFYDENLKQRWATNLELESSYSFLGYRIEADSVRFVLASIWNRDDLPSFLEVPLCLADGNYRKRPHEVAVEGLEKGMQEGERRAVLSTARKLKQMGLSAADITRATGLSEDEIRLL